jgi:RNA polymerase sigma-B factor
MTGKQRQDENRLFRAHRSGDRRAREQLVERFLPLARSIARRYARRGEPLEDLEQVASLALIRAIDGFDADRGTAFSSYAVPSIAGAIKRHYRDAGWSVRPPRELQDLALNVIRLEEELPTATGAPPTAAVIAHQLKVSVEAVLEAREAYQARFCDSLDRPLNMRGSDAPGSLLDGLAARDGELARAEDRVLVDGLLRALDDRERLAVELYYQRELTQVEIGERLGCSQMHVSRILRGAIKKLMLEVSPAPQSSSRAPLRLHPPASALRGSLQIEAHDHLGATVGAGAELEAGGGL